MSKAFDEALEFLLDPSRVTFYTNAERTKPPCPTCGAEGGDPCRALKSRCRLATWHPDRTNEPVPRSQEEQDEIILKLARLYASSWRNQASATHREPRRYPR